jgi:hypothetical protein
VLADVRERVVAIMRAEGTITLARLRDELHTSRRYAQALLEHLTPSASRGDRATSGCQARERRALRTGGTRRRPPEGRRP